MSQELEIFSSIVSSINPDFLKFAPLILRENKSSYCSVLIVPENNPYRNLTINDVSMVFCRIKATAKTRFVAFNKKYQHHFESVGIPCIPEKGASNFFRMDLEVFAPLSPFYNALPKILNEIFISCFSFTPFGCCSKYEDCSNAKHCLHEDQVYSMVCVYRKNLDSGRIFYGTNRNI